MSHRPYIDFRLLISAAGSADAACSVMLLPTAEVGEWLRPVAVASGRAPTPEMLTGLRKKALTAAALVELGKCLGDCLLPEGEIRALFAEIHKQLGEEKGIRLRLMIADPALRTWPWEFAYLDQLGGPASNRGFLALDPRISMVRHEPLARPHDRIGAGHSGDLRELRAIVAAASPTDQWKLNVKQEVERIVKTLNQIEVDGVRIACLPPLEDATLADIDGATQKPASATIFHFAGHAAALEKRDAYGTGLATSGAIFLLRDKANRKSHVVGSIDLARMLRRAGVRLAVFTACETADESESHPWHSVASALVADGIPAVVAMQREVLDDAAVAFSAAFYAGLAAGLSLDESVSVGRLVMLATDAEKPDRPANVEWGLPVLHSRLVDGCLFPERMGQAGRAAEEMRNVISVVAQTVERGGEVVGIRAKRAVHGFQVEIVAENVRGKMTGAILDEVKSRADLRVRENVKTVGPGGSLTGLKVEGDI